MTECPYKYPCGKTPCDMGKVCPAEKPCEPKPYIVPWPITYPYIGDQPLHPGPYYPTITWCTTPDPNWKLKVNMNTAGAQGGV